MGLCVRALCVCTYLLVGPTGASSQASVQLRGGELPSVEQLRSHVFNLADDSMMGRMAGSAGYDKAARYTVAALSRLGVDPAFQEAGPVVSGYSHQFWFSLEAGGARNLRSYNVVGIVPGTDPELRAQSVVVSAHLDHVGTHDNLVYNGASDNASGVAVVLEVARLIAERPLPRSVLFAFFGADQAQHRRRERR